jgi:hypothetical protein
MRPGPKALLCLVVTRRAARIVLVLAALLASAWAAAGVAAAPQLQHIPLPENPTPIPPEPVPVPPPSGPCADTRMRCPDLIVRAPSELKVIRSRFGRVRLGSRNILVNRGAGPMYLLGRRLGRRTMTVRQRIFTTAGTFEEFPLERARFDFWTIPVPPGQGRFWKLRDGLRFELWTAGGPIERFVKFGRKTRFCMRDLREVPGMGGPRTRQFPACNQSPNKRVVRMGISVGWYESYPAFYYEQYVDVTGLRGCYSLRHVADPLGHVFEADESNNTSATRVRLPPRRGRVRGC